MLRRLLNIVSIVSLVLCVALMGMWVRSYFWLDSVGGLIFPNQFLGVQSVLGKLVFIQQPIDPNRGKQSVVSQGSGSADASKDSPWFLSSMKYPVPQHPSGWRRPFYLKLFPDSRANLLLEASIWFLVLISGSLAMALRMRWPPRFNLRSLFIATTFLAVVLGMMAWLDRAWIGK